MSEFDQRSVDEHYLKELFVRYFSVLSIFARQFVHDNEKVKDIVQDVFLNIWEKGTLYRSDEKVKSYLFTAVRNKCINYIRDNKKFAEHDNIADVVKDKTHDIGIEYKELNKQILYEIEQLPEKCKEVFLLSRFEELKYSEIAERLNISVKTVEAQISKALKILRNKFSGYLHILLSIIVNIFSN